MHIANISSRSFLISIILMLGHMFGSLNKSFLQDEEISIQPALENVYTLYSMVAECGRGGGVEGGEGGENKRSNRLNKDKY